MTNPKKFWKNLNSNFALNKRSNCFSCCRIKSKDGIILENKDLANYLSTYYASNGEVLARAFSDSPNLEDLTVPHLPNEFSFKFIPMSVVEKYVNDIDVSKSSGILNLNSVLLKDAFRILVVELTHILNESIRTCTFPDAWSLGMITPIPKEGDSLDAGNWRPITLLPVLGKLLDRAVHYQITTHLNEYDLLMPNQHGFRKGKSTSTAIIELSRQLFDSYNKGLNTSCIFVDYKKAFETLDHEILLRKLKSYGFNANSAAWVNHTLGIEGM